LGERSAVSYQPSASEVPRTGFVPSVLVAGLKQKADC
jgi:hypothetical protein